MRRPKLAILALSIPICVVWDGVVEAIFVQMGFYPYTQVIPWGSIFAGTPGQFPLIWEAVLFGPMLSAAAPLMSVVYLAYGLSFAVIRATGTAQQWRYPESKATANPAPS